MKQAKPKVGTFLYFGACLFLGMYFTFSAVQGDGGLFQRIRIEADAATLRQELTGYELRISALENKTRRLSDGYLDLDLLDEQARSTLGMARADEVFIP